MSYGQYSWLITIKNGASHPMVQDGIYNNHYFGILIMDGMTISHIVSIDHGSYGDFQNKHVPCNAHICPRSTRNNISILQKTLTSAFQKNTPQTLKPSPLK